MDELKAPPRNPLFGSIADLVNGAADYADRPDPALPGGKANPSLALLAHLLSLRSLGITADRKSYGEPLTNFGKANVPLLKPETADVASMALPFPRATAGALAGGMAHGAEAAGPVIPFLTKKFGSASNLRSALADALEARAAELQAAQEAALRSTIKPGKRLIDDNTRRPTVYDVAEAVPGQGSDFTWKGVRREKQADGSFRDGRFELTDAQLQAMREHPLQPGELDPMNMQKYTGGLQNQLEGRRLDFPPQPQMEAMLAAKKAAQAAAFRKAERDYRKGIGPNPYNMSFE